MWLKFSWNLLMWTGHSCSWPLYCTWLRWNYGVPCTFVFLFSYHHVLQFKTEKSSTSKQFEWLPFLSLSVNVYYQTHSDGHFRKQFTLGLKNKSSIDLGWQFVKGYYAIVISKTLVKYLKARNNNTIKCKWFH